MTETTGYRPPSWTPHVLSLFGIALMLALSVWQLQRLAWKEDMLARMNLAQTQPEVPLRSDLPEATLTGLEYHPVRISGTFLEGREYHLGGRYLAGQLGYSILAPLDPGPGLPLIMVDRGWVPADKKDPKGRPETIPHGPQNLHGEVRLPPKPRLFSPQNRPDKNFWFWPDLDAYAKELDRPVAPVILQVVGADVPNLQSPLPIAAPRLPEVRNDHLGYAITWALIGLGILVIYIVWLRGQRQKA